MLQVTFIMEQQLGHRSFYQNLKNNISEHSDIQAHWVEVTYEQPEFIWDRLKFLPEQIRGTLTGRSQVLKELREKPYDVAFYNTQVPAALIPNNLKKHPYVISTDITPLQYDRMSEHYRHQVSRNKIITWYKHRVNQYVFQGAFRVLPWSNWTRQSLIDEYDLLPEQAVVVPPGVDIETWHPIEKERKGPVRILFVGGDFYRKGGAFVLDTFHSLPEGSAKLILVTRTELPDSPGIEVYNNLQANSPELIALYQSSDIFVLPTRAEAFGIAAVEASASGLPVIASQVAGLTDIVIQGETGFLVPIGDARAFSERLSLLVRDANLRLAMGASGRSHVENSFDAKKNAMRIIEILIASLEYN